VLVTRKSSRMGVPTVATTGEVAVSGDETVAVNCALNLNPVAFAAGAVAATPAKATATAVTAMSKRLGTRCVRGSDMAASRSNVLLYARSVTP
jgi:hypothetical protein